MPTIVELLYPVEEQAIFQPSEALGVPRPVPVGEYAFMAPTFAAKPMLEGIELEPLNSVDWVGTSKIGLAAIRAGKRKYRADPTLVFSVDIPVNQTSGLPWTPPRIGIPWRSARAPPRAHTQRRRPNGCRRPIGLRRPAGLQQQGLLKCHGLRRCHRQCRCHGLRRCLSLRGCHGLR